MRFLIRVSAGLLLAGVVASCAPQPEILVMAATSTPQGAIVPTRAPTQTLQATSTLLPTDTSLPTETAADTATSLPTETATEADTETPEPTETTANTATLVPTETIANTTAPTVTLAITQATQAALVSTPAETPSQNDPDGDGLTLAQEEAAGTDPTLADTDVDGLSDGEEIGLWQTNPLEIDTDGDLLSDGDEVTTYGTSPTNRDTDSDGLTDGDEVQIYSTNPLLTDTDGDTLGDAREVRMGSDPTLTDTDGDGQPDGSDPTPLINHAETSTPEPTAAPLIDTTGLRYLNSTAFMPASIAGNIALGDLVTGSITNDQPFALYSLEATPGTEINVTMAGAPTNTNEFYPRILVVDPKGREVARTSDYSFEPQVAIRGLTLNEVGAYIIVASRVNGQFGASQGDYELGVDLNASGATQFGIRSEPINYNTAIENTIDDQNTERIHTFQGREGDVITIQMNAQSADLDPLVVLSDNLGNPLAFNDDDYQGQNYDSGIHSYVLPRSGYYSVKATHYDGAASVSGPYRLLVQLESQTPLDQSHAIVAPLNFSNSLSLLSNLQYYTEFSAGDSVDEDKNELKLDTLLTFYLPPLDADFQLGSAHLELEPCIQRNQGFAALGDLSVLEDQYGILSDDHDFTRPAAGARLLARTPDCSGVDITDAVREAYEEGRTSLQLRLTFRTPTTNGQPDNIAFTPRLFLEPAG